MKSSDWVQGDLEARKATVLLGTWRPGNNPARIYMYTLGGNLKIASLKVDLLRKS